MEKSSVTVKQAVALGYGSRSTLNRRISDGSLPSWKVNNRRYFDIEDLEAMRDKSRGDERDLFNPLVRAIAANAGKFSNEQILTLIETLVAGGDFGA